MYILSQARLVRIKYSRKDDKANKVLHTTPALAQLLAIGMIDYQQLLQQQKTPGSVNQKK